MLKDIPPPTSFKTAKITLMEKNLFLELLKLKTARGIFRRQDSTKKNRFVRPSTRSRLIEFGKIPARRFAAAGSLCGEKSWLNQCFRDTLSGAG